MAATHRRRASTIFTWLLFIILIGRSVESQPPPAGSTNSTSDANNNNQYFAGHFNPYTVIIIVVLISAFFLLGFFSIYIRQCGNYQSNFPNNDATAAAIARLRFQRGLNREVLESFPTLVYSEVKEHKIGKGALECAICLNEFEDDETIRLLPQCDHVFHLDCIDAWLDTHVTCPVCRTNYADYSSTDFTTRAHVGNDESGVTTGPAAAVVNSDTPPVDHRVDLIDDMEERKVEMRELARIATRLRGNGARRSRRLSRSHSTGHSMMLNGEVGLDRYTLRLPENVRKEIIAAGKLKRAKTFGVIGAGDASMRRISRGGGEGSSRRGRTIRLGRSDRWPSFFGGAVSAKIPAWGNWRKAEEGSTSRKVSFSKPAADTFAGGAGGGSGGLRANNYNNSDESSTAALNRV